MRCDGDGIMPLHSPEKGGLRVRGRDDHICGVLIQGVAGDEVSGNGVFGGRS